MSAEVPKFIRPSALQLAEQCAHSAILAEQFPGGNEATEEGTRVDHEASAALAIGCGTEPVDPTSLLLVRWARERFAAGPYLVQEKVRLDDPETGELITEGTPDLLVTGDVLTVIDWKKKGQLWAGHVAEPDDNLQQLAYGVAAGLKHRAAAFQVVLVFWEEGEPLEIRESRVIESSKWFDIIDRIKAIQQKPPVPTTGSHCMDCYQRAHCAAWLLPAYKGETALAPFMVANGLTKDNAGRALMAVEAMKDALEIAKGLLINFAKRNGGIRVGDKLWAISQVQGRRSADVDALEKAGLAQYVKRGAPFDRPGWRKAR